MASLNHIHSYERLRKTPKGNIIYRCVHPLCTHTNDKDAILGKANKCACGNEFVLTMEDLRRKLPKCFSCSDTKASREQKRMENILTMAGLDTSPENVQIPEEDRLR